MKKIFILIFLTHLGFSQEFEIDGDLSVTGSVESTTIDSLKEVVENLKNQLNDLVILTTDLSDNFQLLSNSLQNPTITHSFNQISLEILDNANPDPHVFDPIPLVVGKPVTVYYIYSLGESDMHRNYMSISFSNPITSLEGEITGSSMDYNGSNWNIGGFTPEQEIDFMITVNAQNQWDNPNYSTTHTANATVLVFQ